MRARERFIVSSGGPLSGRGQRVSSAVFPDARWRRPAYSRILQQVYLPSPMMPAAPLDRHSRRSLSRGSSVWERAREERFISSASWREVAEAGLFHIPRTLNTSLKYLENFESLLILISDRNTPAEKYLRQFIIIIHGTLTFLSENSSLCTSCTHAQAPIYIIIKREQTNWKTINRYIKILKKRYLLMISSNIFVKKENIFVNKKHF